MRVYARAHTLAHLIGRSVAPIRTDFDTVHLTNHGQSSLLMPLWVSGYHPVFRSWVMSRLTWEMVVGLCPQSHPHPALSLSVSHYASPDGRLHKFKAIPNPLVVLFVQASNILHELYANTAWVCLSTLWVILLLKLSFQIVMAWSKQKCPSRICSCRCNRLVSPWTENRLKMMAVSPQPPKWRRITNFQVGKESLTIRSGKRKRSCMGNNSSRTCWRGR